MSLALQSQSLVNLNLGRSSDCVRVCNDFGSCTPCLDSLLLFQCNHCSVTVRIRLYAEESRSTYCFVLGSAWTRFVEFNELFMVGLDLGPI